MRFKPVWNTLILSFSFSCTSYQPMEKIESDLTAPLKIYHLEKIKAAPQEIWWQGLQDDQLKKTIVIALQNNFQVRGQIEKIGQLVHLAKASGSRLLPSLTGELASSYGQQTSQEKPTPSRVTTTGWGWGINFRLAFELDIFGQTRENLAARDYQLLGQIEQLKSLLLNTSVSVATLWFSIAETHAMLDLLENTIQEDQKSIEQLLTGLQLGTTKSYQIIQVKQRLLGTQSQILSMQLKLRSQQQRLELLVGNKVNGLQRGPKRSMAPTFDFKSYVIPASEIKNHPQIRSAFLKLKAADATFAAAIAAQYPKLSFSASYGTRSDSLSDFIDPQAWLWNMAGNITAPLFNHQSLQHQAVAAGYSRREEWIAYNNTLVQKFSDLQQTLDSIHFDQLHIQTQEKIAALSKSALTLIEQGYTDGINTWTEFLNSRKELFSAQKALINVRYIQLFNHLKLQTHLGGGWFDSFIPDMFNGDQ